MNKDGKELNDVDIILVSVTRKPSEGGDTLLTKSWYNSEDNGNTINGRTRQAFQGGHTNPNNPGTRIYIERYIISFAVNKGNTEYDTFTVDPVIRGNQ